MRCLRKVLGVICIAALPLVVAAWAMDQPVDRDVYRTPIVSLDASEGSVGDGNDAPVDPETGGLETGTEFPAHLVDDLSRPSLCGGLSIEPGFDLGNALRVIGLDDEIPVETADELGSIGGYYCSTDVLTGKVAVVFIGANPDKGLAVANDRAWLDSVLIDHRSYLAIPSIDQRHMIVGRADDGDDATNENVNINSLLKDTQS